MGVKLTKLDTVVVCVGFAISNRLLNGETIKSMEYDLSINQFTVMQIRGKRKMEHFFWRYMGQSFSLNKFE